MKVKIASSILVLCLIAYGGRAGARSGNEGASPESVKMNFRNTLWFNSSGTAGLGFAPLPTYNALSLEGNFDRGLFRPEHKGSAINGISLNTSGATMLGKFFLWGDFSFRNIFENGTRYNTALYEIREDMPYWISDNVVSDWNKQEYRLSAKMASPVVGKMLTFGLEMNYDTKVGAKQRDPRSETYKYAVEILPSMAFRIAGRHILGVSGLFSHSFERSEPSLNNHWEEQKIYYNKGLGEGTIGKVGGNDGLKTLMYNTLKYGGSLQYSYKGNTELLGEAGIEINRCEGKENPRLPKSLGSTGGLVISGKLQMLTGAGKNDRISISGEYSDTKGTEYVLQLNTTAFEQEWEIISSNIMSTFSRISAEAEYDHLFGRFDSGLWKWKAGASLKFSGRDYIYFIPESTFRTSGLGIYVNAGKNFAFRNSTLSILAEGGYNLPLGEGYKFGGGGTSSWLQEYYRMQEKVFNTGYADFGCEVSYTLNGRKVNYFVLAEGKYAKPLSIGEFRLCTLLSAGIIF